MSEALLSLRNMVVQSTDLLSPSYRAQPSAPATVEANFERAFPQEQAEQLIVILLLAAVKQLQQKDGLHNLHQLADEKLAGDSLSNQDLQWLIQELYDRVTVFCPLELAGLFPPPNQLKNTSFNELWKLLGQPALNRLWENDCSLGNVYQLFCEPARRACQTSIQSANKSLDLSKLIHFTQLYTPSWVVDFLLENTMLPPWSKLAHHADIESYSKFCLSSIGRELNGSLPASQITLLDPACGSGHFLLGALDLFVNMYEAEGLLRNEAIKQAVSTNLAGVDIDPAALWVASLSLLIKCWLKGGLQDSERVQLAHVQNGSPTPLLGSLSKNWGHIQDHPLNRKYQVVVTNPPYIGRKLLDRNLKAALKQLFPTAHQDLCASFIARSFELLQAGGRLGVIAQASLMSLPSYGGLRKHIVENMHLVSVVDAGPGVFPLQGGEKVNSALLVIESQGGKGSPSPTCFIDIRNQVDKEAAIRQFKIKPADGSSDPDLPDGFHLIDPASFARFRKFAFNYDCPSFLIDKFHTAAQLGSKAEIRQGLATTDNERFVRYCWDVEPEKIGVRWFPYVKGAGSERWFSPVIHMVDWENNGSAIKKTVAESYPYLNGNTAWVVKNERYYFQEGLTFSFVNSKQLAVRYLPSGCIFDVGGSAIFAPADQLNFLLAYLNSSFIETSAKLLNPTLNFQVGDLKQLPFFEFEQGVMNTLSELGSSCLSIKRQLNELLGSTPRLSGNGITFGGKPGSLSDHQKQVSLLTLKLEEMQTNIDERIIKSTSEILQLDENEKQLLLAWTEGRDSTRSPSTQTTASNWAHQLILHKLRQVIGDTNFLALPADPVSLSRAFNLDPGCIQDLQEATGVSLDQYVLRQFWQDHQKRYHRSPFYFAIPLREHAAILLFSSMSLRRSMNGSSTGAPWQLTRKFHSASDTAHVSIEQLIVEAENVIAKISHQLQQIPDWTGKTLSQLLA